MDFESRLHRPVATRWREVIHHRRAGDMIETRVVAADGQSGILRPDPPEIDLQLARIYEGTALAPR